MDPKKCTVTHKTPEGYKQIPMVEESFYIKAIEQIKTLTLIIKMHEEAEKNVIALYDNRFTAIKDLKAAYELSKRGTDEQGK